MLKRRTKYKSSRFAKRRRRKFFFRIVLYSVLLVSIVTGLSFLSRADFLSISDIELSELETLNNKDIEQIVYQELDKSFLGLFSKKNILLYPKGRLRHLLLDEFKQISKADISLKNFNILTIRMVERQARAIWCGGRDSFPPSDNLNGMNRNIPESCFFVDKVGFIFASSPTFSGDAFLRYYGEISGEEPIGSYFINSEDALKLENFFSLLSRLPAEPVSVIKDSREKIIINLNKGTSLIINIDDNMENIFENLITLITEPEYNLGREDMFSAFEYIDLRFGNKILYKLNDSE